MLKDIREMKAKVDRAKRENALRQEKLKEIEKSEIYGSVQQQKLDEAKRSVENRRKDIRMGKAFSLLKLSGVAALFLVLGFALNSALRDDRKLGDVKILCREEPASETDAEEASRYVRQIIEEFCADGAKALVSHWSSGADEESRFYAEETLSTIGTSTVELGTVSSLPDNSLRVKCECGGRRISFLLVKNKEGLSLAAVN